MDFTITQILATFVLLTITRLTYIAYLAPLSRIPKAHFTTPFSSLWLIYQKFQGRENRIRLAAHRRLGPVVRLGPNEISVNSMGDVYAVFESKSFDKTDWYPNAFRGWKSPLLVTITKQEPHARRRELMSSKYSKTSVCSSSALKTILSNRVEARFKDELHKWASSGITVDIFLKSKACLMDVITAWLYGIDHGTDFLRVESEERHFSKCLNGTFEGFIWRSEFYGFISSLEKLRLPIFPWMSTTEIAQLALQDWSLEKCKNAQESARVGRDTTSFYAHLRHGLEKTESPEKIESLLMDEMLDHCLTGQYPTGIIVTYIVWELSRRLEWQQMLHHELAEFSCTAEMDTKVYPTNAVDKLPILDAIVTETLRLYSPNPGPWPRYNPTSVTTVGKYSGIPAGTTISASSYCLHRNEKVFPDPEQWRPDRWLEAQGKNRTEMSKWFWAFGSGSFMCLGSHLAILSIKAVIRIIYSDFRAEIVDDTGIEQVDAPVAGPVGDKLLVKFVVAGKKGK